MEKLSGFDTAAFSYGYCQYDFLPKNFHFDAQNQLTFFDFDFAGKGFLANDIMVYWAHHALNGYLGRCSSAVASHSFATFLSAYQQVRPVSDEEVQAIPYLNIGWWIFYLGFQYENFDDWSNMFFTERYLKERTALIKGMANKYCTL
jgi:Ser/Thr protein kinase RdoA (MazF antagonist)